MTAVFWHHEFQIENMDFTFLDTLISPLLEVAGGEWLVKERAHVDAMATDVASVLQALRAP